MAFFWTFKGYSDRSVTALCGWVVVLAGAILDAGSARARVFNEDLATVGRSKLDSGERRTVGWFW
jgi:hypothetical protein